MESSIFYYYPLDINIFKSPRMQYHLHSHNNPHYQPSKGSPPASLHQCQLNWLQLRPCGRSLDLRYVATARLTAPIFLCRVVRVLMTQQKRCIITFVKLRQLGLKNSQRIHSSARCNSTSRGQLPTCVRPQKSNFRRTWAVYSWEIGWIRTLE